MSSEVETSRENTFKAVQRDSSTLLGMTKIALIQMRCGVEPCYPPELHATICKIDVHYRPDHSRRSLEAKDKTRTVPEAKDSRNS